MPRQPSSLLVFVFVSACSSTVPTPAPGANTIASCRAEFSVAKGYGYQNDLGGVTSPPDAGVVDAGVAHPALDYAVAACKAGGGAACDPATFMTHDAAVCVAKLSGLAQGIAAFKAGIAFQAKYMRVVWSVQNLTSGTPGGAAAGDTVTLDAVDGSLLAHGSWSATP